jgi:hypothetical protein
MDKQNLNYTLSNLSQKDLDLFKSLFDYSEVRGAMSANKNSVTESHYIRVYGFRYWDEKEMNTLIKSVDDFNSKSESCEMRIDEYSDYEVEYDNDRSYPASYRFSMIPKNR